MYVSIKLAYNCIRSNFLIKRIAAMDSRLDFESERVSPVFLVRSTLGHNRAYAGGLANSLPPWNEGGD